MTKKLSLPAAGAGRVLPTVNPAVVPSSVTVRRKPVEASMVPASVMFEERETALICCCSKYP
jgi:hypothetical protein